MTDDDRVYGDWLNILGSDEITDTTPDILADLHTLHDRAQASHQLSGRWAVTPPPLALDPDGIRPHLPMTPERLALAGRLPAARPAGGAVIPIRFHVEGGRPLDRVRLYWAALRFAWLYVWSTPARRDSMIAQLIQGGARTVKDGRS